MNKIRLNETPIFEYIKRDYFFDLNRRNDPSYYLPINMIFYLLLITQSHPLAFKWFT